MFFLTRSARSKREQQETMEDELGGMRWQRVTEARVWT
jgi:hypothetical protein